MLLDFFSTVYLKLPFVTQMMMLMSVLSNLIGDVKEPLKTTCTLAVTTLNDNGQCQLKKVSLALGLAIIITMMNVQKKVG